MTTTTSMSGMSMMTSVSSTAASAAATGMSGMDMSMDMGMGECKSSMLWNWFTIDACFLSSTWHITSSGMFAASCIGVILLVISLEFLRRVGKEYDASILRKFQRQAASRAAEIQSMSQSDSGTIPLQAITFRATPLQQLIRSVIHAVSFGVAYIIMLLVMSYNGYLIISIIIGAGLGKFFCDWMVHRVPVTDTAKGPKAEALEDITLCCG